jgi:hypothetical protein
MGTMLKTFFLINILNLKHLKAYIMITLTLPMQKWLIVFWGEKQMHFH